MIALVIVGIIVVLLVLAVLWSIATYNRLVRQRNQVQDSWAQVEVQLKRRYDLIPNLVETVKGYASHERQTLEAVTQARAGALSASAPAEQAASDNVLTGALRSLFAVAESYPDLKANQSFLSLQQQLDETEGRISYSRQYYNDAVLHLNNMVRTFPTVLVASTAQIGPEQYFEAAPEEQAPVAVHF
ncbi:MAG TPA: LemA family protein [Acidimicrobiales bacterium]|nr:LemA family protein [Acidimicrobiales bacterium]